MSNIQLYQLLHFSGILLVFFAYGSLVTRALLLRATSGNAGLPASTLASRKLGAILSGIGLLLILVSGFGMVSVLQLGWPLWIIIKIVIWVLLGVMLTLLNRKPGLGPLWWVATLVLGFAAIAAVVIRPITA